MSGADGSADGSIPTVPAVIGGLLIEPIGMEQAAIGLEAKGHFAELMGS